MAEDANKIVYEIEVKGAEEAAEHATVLSR
jgi:hypothetical protein